MLSIKNIFVQLEFSKITYKFFFLLISLLIFPVSADEITGSQNSQSPEDISSLESLHRKGMDILETGPLGGDKSAALVYFQEAGEKGYLDSQLMLGDMYGFSFGIPPSYEKAAYWFKKAADQGSARAQLYVADLYLEGLGFDKNISEGLRYMHLALENSGSDEETKRIANIRIKKFTDINN